MKKLITVFLLSIILFCTAGYELIFAYLLFDCGQETCNSELASINITLIINSSNKEKLIQKNNREVIFDGILYDIKSKEVVGDNIVLHCIMDLNEQGLLEHFEKAQTENNEKDKNGIQNKYFHKDTLTLFITGMTPAVKLHQSLNLSYSYLSLSYSQPIIDLTTPPPQVS